MNKALVVFSGGQDSTTCLGLALAAGYECHAIGFYYGQRHAVELQQAKKIATMVGVPYTVLDVEPFGKMVASASALISPDQNVGEASSLKPNLPASFVPNRNAMMLTMAHAYAQMIGAYTIITGVSQSDYSGYPDCRDRFITALQNALNIGYETNINILTPLMHVTKGETFKLAEECGFLDIVVNESHTCYNGVRQDVAHDRFAWGHGCGECPACKLRAKGWEDFNNLTRIA